MSSVSIPKTMKAIQVSKTGGPEANVLKEIPVPTPKDDEVLIKIEWTGVNFIDIYFRTGAYPSQYPYTVGQDAVGTLLTLPLSYSHPTLPASIDIAPLQIGDKVLTTTSRTFAEYMVAPVSKVITLPDGIDPKEAPALATTGITAAYLAKESYAVKKDDWVLIRAAAGGVGLLLCQICLSLGANVIGTVSSEAKAELVKATGVKHVLLTTNSSEDNVKTVLALTPDGEGVKCVYDGVGKDTWEEDFEIIRRLGTIVSFGNASGAPPALNIARLTAKALKVTRPKMDPMIRTHSEFLDYASDVFNYVKAGNVKVKVHKVYDFTQEGVIQAQKDLESRSTTGKLVIKVA